MNSLCPQGIINKRGVFPWLSLLRRCGSPLGPLPSPASPHQREGPVPPLHLEGRLLLQKLSPHTPASQSSELTSTFIAEVHCQMTQLKYTHPNSSTLHPLPRSSPSLISVPQAWLFTPPSLSVLFIRLKLSGTQDPSGPKQDWPQQMAHFQSVQRVAVATQHHPVEARGGARSASGTRGYFGDWSQMQGRCSPSSGRSQMAEWEENQF